MISNNKKDNIRKKPSQHLKTSSSSSSAANLRTSTTQSILGQHDAAVSDPEVKWKPVFYPLLRIKVLILIFANNYFPKNIITPIWNQFS